MTGKKTYANKRMATQHFSSNIPFALIHTFIMDKWKKHTALAKATESNSSSTVPTPQILEVCVCVCETFYMVVMDDGYQIFHMSVLCVCVYLWWYEWHFGCYVIYTNRITSKMIAFHSHIYVCMYVWMNEMQL